MTEKKPKKATKKRGRPKVKKTPKVKKIKKPVVKKKISKRTYLFAVGRRKSAVARVRLHKTGEPKIIVNEKDYKDYFDYPEYWKKIEQPLLLTGLQNKHFITIKVQGGGKLGQAEGCRLGIARILCQVDPDLRMVLKKAKLIRRDHRVKERKKFGLKRARRAPQWKKR